MGSPCQTQPEAEEDWGGGFNAICSPPAQWREREGALFFSQLARYHIRHTNIDH